MIVIGTGVGIIAAIAPHALQRAFGIPRSEITLAGDLGWRLFATRNLYLGAMAMRGDRAAVAAFGPLQALDQAVFWHAFATRSVPRKTSAAAIATSATIVALDLRRRTQRGESCAESAVAKRPPPVVRRTRCLSAAIT